MVTHAPFGQVERDSVRLAAVLLFAGVLVTAVAGFLHPEGADPNDHRTIFAIYAASQPRRASRTPLRSVRTW
jgi:hypothetical protein